MRKLLNKPWFVAVMALAALLLVAKGVFSGAEDFGLGGLVGSDASAEGDGAPADAAPLPASAIVQSLSVPSLVRDPFAVRVKADESEKIPEPDSVDTVHLSAIWTQDGRTLVLLNERICQNGDEIGRLKIESATQDGIWITHWKGRDFLSIGGNFTLNTPAGKFSSATTL